MPFGAHETMEINEILRFKQFLIEHFSLYEEHSMDPTLSEMLHRHLSTAIEHYNHLVSYTHDYHTAQTKMIPLHRVQTFDVQYGIRDTSQVAPATGRGRLSEQSLTQSMLQIHKNSAVLHMKAALECADPNLRQLMVNGSIMCEQQAYEVFNYMNHRGWYQLPTFHDQAGRTMMQTFQQMPPGMSGMTEPTRETGWGMARSDIAQPQGRTSAMDPEKQSEWGRGTTDYPTHIGNGNDGTGNFDAVDTSAGNYNMGGSDTYAGTNNNAGMNAGGAEGIANAIENNTSGNNTLGNGNNAMGNGNNAMGNGNNAMGNGNNAMGNGNNAMGIGNNGNMRGNANYGAGNNVGEREVAGNTITSNYNDDRAADVTGRTFYATNNAAGDRNQNNKNRDVPRM